jgi:hypothetical protein
MKCPHCCRPVDFEATTCYSCGYSLANAEELYGRNFVKMNRLHDAAHCLRKQERTEVEIVLDQLEFQFPQLLFCTYLGALTEPMRLNELGFWLLNHAEVEGADFARPNENAILVLIDVNSKQAGISLGYFTEELLPEVDAYRCLRSVRPYLLNGTYGSALRSLFLKIGRALCKSSRARNKRETKQGNDPAADPEGSPPAPGPRLRAKKSGGYQSSKPSHAYG